MNHQAIYNTHKTVTSIGEEAYDSSGSVVPINDKLVSVEVIKLDREQLQQAINSESLAYLASTDWYIIRLQETDVAVPQTILDKRSAARLAVV